MQELIVPLPFRGSSNFTLGVEIELQLLDPNTLDLTPRSHDVLEACEKKGIHRVKAELHQSMLEIDTPICGDVKQCKESLSNTLKQVRRICLDLGLFVSISGTHPFQQWSERLIYPSERYHYLESKFQWLVRRMNVYGMHLHIGVSDGDQAIKLLNGLISYLPLFLALSASSPFWQGVDTKFQSCRLGIIDSFPYSGIPPHFSSWQEFEYYYDTLLNAGAIHSTKDLYWLIRPNAEFGTIEVRIFDGMSTLSETAALVALTQCLAKHILDNPSKSDPYDHWVAPSNMLIASRDGLNGSIAIEKEGIKKPIKEFARSCLERLSPIAAELGCLEELMYIHTILKNGNSSERQRKVFEDTNCLRTVVEATKKEFDHELISRGELARL